MYPTTDPAANHAHNHNCINNNHNNQHNKIEHDQYIFIEWISPYNNQDSGWSDRQLDEC